MKIRITRGAKAEVKRIRAYLDRQVPGLGSRFAADLQDALDQIAHDSLRFRNVETLPDKHDFRRALLSVFRYSVIYKTTPKEVVVLAVPHGSQRPNYWVNRE